MTHKNCPYHLVETRPWPISGSLGVIIRILGLIKWFHSRIALDSEIQNYGTHIHS